MPQPNQGKPAPSAPSPGNIMPKKDGGSVQKNGVVPPPARPTGTKG